MCDIKILEREIVMVSNTNVKKVKSVKNRFYNSEYNEEELKYFKSEIIDQILNFQKTNSKFTETPLIKLNALSKRLNVNNIYVKDESKRFGLNAFKVMGGVYAIGKYIAEKLEKDISELTFDEMRSKETKEKIGEITFISATDGNHGRGVAWAARELGQKSVIYMPKGSSLKRLNAIKDEGATAKITDVNYDETIRICDKLARENNWVMVQDTAWEGYDKIPLWIMQGYSSIAKEIVEDLKSENLPDPTHIILQAGVGSFAAGITSCMINYYGSDNIKIGVVEPDLADCYYRSFANNDGEIETVTGDMNSIMAGLCCGEPNTRGFRILKQYADSFYSCSDDIAALGMRVMGNPLKEDQKIISGESGAVPLGLLYYLLTENEQKKQEFGLNSDSNILIINTEGDTDPEHYLKVVWEGKNPNLLD